MCGMCLWLSVWLYFEVAGVCGCTLRLWVCGCGCLWLYFEVVGVWLRVSVVVL